MPGSASGGKEGAREERAVGGSPIFGTSCAGWTFKSTVADGNCALDCMAYFQGLGRTAAVWEELREELATFMISVSEVQEWQEAFDACQEFSPESETASSLPEVGDVSFVSALASTAPAASAAASASTAASAETPALPAPGLQAKKAAATGGSAEVATGEVPGKALAAGSENTVSASSVASASAPAALASSYVASASDPAAAAVAKKGGERSTREREGARRRQEHGGI